MPFMVLVATKASLPQNYLSCFGVIHRLYDRYSESRHAAPWSPSLSGNIKLYTGGGTMTA